MVSAEWREYTLRLNQHQSTSMQKFTEEAKNAGVPIMQPEAMALVEQFIRVKKPSRILEIGTAVGWSAINIALSAGPDSSIITVERDPVMVERAKKNIRDFHLEQVITVLEGDVLELEETIQAKAFYDFILIDAGKGHYQEYFTKFIPMLSLNGIVICDNVYFRGYSIDPEQSPKRLKRLAQKMNAFNLWLSQYPGFDTVFVPVGDGLSISTRRMSAPDREDI